MSSVGLRLDRADAEIDLELKVFIDLASTTTQVVFCLIYRYNDIIDDSNISGGLNNHDDCDDVVFLHYHHHYPHH